MKILFILSLLISLFYLLFKSKKAMHMLQQNYYNDDNRYINWLNNNLVKSFSTFDILFILFAILVFVKNSYVSVIVFILLYVVSFFLYRNKLKNEQSKKPLVITARVKRLYTTLIVLYLVISLVMICTFKIKYIAVYYLIIGLYIYLNWYIIVLCNIINKPVEKMVFNHYKKLAKNKLSDMKDLKKVAITGSYGKTSTKNILNDILNVKYNSYATEKSFNTMNGLMISINNKLDKFTDVYITEMGAFKKGEIKELCDLIHPIYGILTIIGTAHLESFKTRENIRDAKFELIDSLPSDGIAILNMDDEYQTSYDIKSDCKKVWVSLKNKKADVYASDIKLFSKGTSFKVTFKDSNESVLLETKLLGDANVYNIVQSVALAYYLGLDLKQIAIGVKRIKPIEHRLELKKYGDINIIDDAYNSNPVGAKMAVDVLGMMDGTKIIVTPGMVELGEKQHEYNYEFGRQISKVCDHVILVGEEQTKPILEGLKKERFDDKKIHVLNDVKKAFPLMKSLSDKETYVLLENDLPDIFNE